MHYRISINTDGTRTCILTTPVDGGQLVVGSFDAADKADLRDKVAMFASGLDTYRQEQKARRKALRFSALALRGTPSGGEAA